MFTITRAAPKFSRWSLVAAAATTVSFMALLIGCHQIQAAFDQASKSNSAALAAARVEMAAQEMELAFSEARLSLSSEGLALSSAQFEQNWTTVQSELAAAQGSATENSGRYEEVRAGAADFYRLASWAISGLQPAGESSLTVSPQDEAGALQARVSTAGDTMLALVERVRRSETAKASQAHQDLVALMRGAAFLSAAAAGAACAVLLAWAQGRKRRVSPEIAPEVLQTQSECLNGTASGDPDLARQEAALPAAAPAIAEDRPSEPTAQVVPFRMVEAGPKRNGPTVIVRRKGRSDDRRPNLRVVS